jgi:hypothetical protein
MAHQITTAYLVPMEHHSQNCLHCDGVAASHCDQLAMQHPAAATSTWLSSAETEERDRRALETRLSCWPNFRLLPPPSALRRGFRGLNPRAMPKNRIVGSGAAGVCAPVKPAVSTGAHKQSRSEIAQGARLAAPCQASYGRKPLQTCTLGWHRRALGGALQAHPVKYKGAPWLARGPHR